MRNILLALAYDGTDFYGWQRQPNAPSIQGCLETALEKVTGNRARVLGSGRTDAGVHALSQVANFKTDRRIPCQNLLEALNHVLPPAVRIKEAREVREDFHARRDARAKTYRYRIHQAAICSPFLSRFVWHYPFPLDHQCMAEAARLIEGEHDFTSFAGSVGAVREPLASDVDDAREHLDGCPAEEAAREQHEGAPLQVKIGRSASNPVRRIFSSRILWRPRTSMLIYEARGSGFLNHMVRNLVGTLVEIGRGKLGPDDISRILAARDRNLAGPTAPACGLCLVRVEYS